MKYWLHEIYFHPYTHIYAIWFENGKKENHFHVVSLFYQSAMSSHTYSIVCSYRMSFRSTFTCLLVFVHAKTVSTIHMRSSLWKFWTSKDIIFDTHQRDSPLVSDWRICVGPHPKPWAGADTKIKPQHRGLTSTLSFIHSFIHSLIIQQQTVGQ